MRQPLRGVSPIPVWWGVGVWVWLGLLVAGSLSARATSQAACELKVEGETLGVHGIRLNPALSNRLEGIRRGRDYVVSSTGNYKGFGTVLRLRGRMLFLERLWMEDNVEVSGRAQTDVTLEGAGAPGERPPLFASWFTGTLRHYLGASRSPNTHVRDRVRIYTFKDGLLEDIREEATGPGIWRPD